jgi:IS5 family transposase
MGFPSLLMEPFMIAQPVKQLDFLGVEKRRRELSAEGDPLEVLARVIPWESFRRGLDAALGRDKITTGRPPVDVVKMLKLLVLQHLYNLSDFQASYQLRDRISWQRFVGIELGETVPDEKTLWAFRERLTQVDAIEETFYWFNRHLREEGFAAKGGTLVDATIIEAPIRRANDEGTTTQEKAQRDDDATWVKKNDLSFYGYKNHVSVDAAHKLVQCYDVTPCSTHDSQCSELLIDTPNESPDVFGDPAYRSQENEVFCMATGKASKIHYKAYRNKPLHPELERRNGERSKTRVRVEHVFGAQKNDQNMRLIRTIGLARARAKIGLSNLVYNMKRFAYLVTHAPPNPAIAIG